MAQYDEYIQSTTKDATTTQDKVYIICPHTWIDVGDPRNIAIGDIDFVGGDYPIWPLLPNTIIQCGSNGRYENNCTLSSGILQVFAQTYVPIDSYRPGASSLLLERNLRLDNVTIRGFGFTGVLTSAASFVGSSVVVSQAGHLTMEDCHWKDMTSPNVLMLVARNRFQIVSNYALEPRSSHLTVRRSTFDTILYDGPIFLAIDHSLTIEDTTFRSLTPTVLNAFENCFWYVEEKNESIDILGGCANLVTCLFDAHCTLQNVCVGEAITIGVNTPGLLFWHNWYNTTTSNDEAGIQFSNNFLDPSVGLECGLSGVLLSNNSSSSSNVLLWDTPVCWDDYEEERVVGNVSPGRIASTAFSSSVCPATVKI